MYANPFHPSLLAATVHFPVKIAFADGENAAVRFHTIEHFEIVLNLIRQKLRHGDDAVAFFRFGSGNEILAVQPLIGFIDGDSAFLKIEISGSEGQQLSLPDAAPVEHLERIEREGLVHHGLRKFQILLLGPEQHLPVFLFAHAPGLFTGILSQIVIAHRVIEDGAELVVDGLEIDRRIGLALLVLVVHHLILPGDDLLSRDFTHFQFTEIGQQLGADDMILGGPGVFLEPGFHVCRIEVHETFEGHVQIGGRFVELLSLPCLCLPLSLKSPLLGLLALAVPVGIALDRPPGVGLFFLIYCQQLPLLSFSP